MADNQGRPTSEMSTKRNRIPWIVILIAIWLTIVANTAAQDEFIHLGPECSQERQRPGVVFPHESHMENYDCLDCHHQYEAGENVLDEDELYTENDAILCASCHSGSGRLTIRQAYHFQCIGCHIDVRKSGENSGPELCGNCHTPLPKGAME
jgi:hypothetical protein